MGLNQARQQGISEDEYLQGELLSDIRHELIHGEAYAMTGSSRNHQRISGNIFSALKQHLANKPSEPFINDMKVKVDGCFLYPDALVVCDDEQGHDYYTEKPSLIIEVLSKTTRRMDKTVKLAADIAIPTLQEYVLIEQDCVDVEVLRRSNHWLSEHYFLGDSFSLESIGLNLNVNDIYLHVKNEDMLNHLQQTERQAG